MPLRAEATDSPTDRSGGRLGKLRRRLDEVSAPASIHPYMFFESFIQGMISGGTAIDAWKPVRLYRSTHTAESQPETTERKAS